MTDRSLRPRSRTPQWMGRLVPKTKTPESLRSERKASFQIVRSERQALQASVRCGHATSGVRTPWSPRPPEVPPTRQPISPGPKRRANESQCPRSPRHVRRVEGCSHGCVRRRSCPSTTTDRRHASSADREATCRRSARTEMGCRPASPASIAPSSPNSRSPPHRSAHADHPSPPRRRPPSVQRWTSHRQVPRRCHMRSADLRSSRHLRRLKDCRSRSVPH